jgi:enoyl-CoA hydratase/carnithine racemase
LLITLNRPDARNVVNTAFQASSSSRGDRI